MSAIRLVAAEGTVLADPTHLRQVLLILLDNAIRYTPPGGLVQLETSLYGRRRQIIVSDNGYGIPAQNLPHVFERFYQVDQPGVESSRSNGLGLSIAKGLMEAQEGTIAIESRVGEGTRVTLTLPSGAPDNTAVSIRKWIVHHKIGPPRIFPQFLSELRKS